MGGGSFLDQRLLGIENVTLPLGFIGVGIGHTIEPNNRAALKRARFVIVRDHLSATRCSNAFLAPDVVLSRKDFKIPKVQKPEGAPKKVVVLLNEFFYPGWDSKEWQSTPYYRFSQEFAKVCESLMSRGYHITFLPMCISGEIDDRRMAASVIGRMKHRGKVNWYIEKSITDDVLFKHLSYADLVITQRLHGAIYAILAEKTFVVIRSHDKLRGLLEDCNWSGHLDYYAFTDEEFFKVLSGIEGKIVDRSYVEYAQKRWSELAEIVVKLK